MSGEGCEGLAEVLDAGDAFGYGCLKVLGGGADGGDFEVGDEGTGGEFDRERAEDGAALVGVAGDVQDADRFEVDEDQAAVVVPADADEAGVGRVGVGQLVALEKGWGVGGAVPQGGLCGVGGERHGSWCCFGEVEVDAGGAEDDGFDFG
ncbi:hypothetical protein SANTM175S_03310 [Streptomyces antimycoticus]